MNIMAQYLKDLSFENPNAPQSLNNPDAQPQIDISVNVNARTLAPTDYEVELELGVKAVDGETAVFEAEMQYAGIFRLENIPEEHMHPIVLIECPRMLFPFARQILADAIRNGGDTSCNIDRAFEEAITCHMATMAYQLGRKVEWDPVQQRVV